MTSRLAPVRRRVRVVKTAVAAGGIALFAAAGALARVHFAGHQKQGLTSLAPPASLVEVVRRDQLEAGILAPAEAPPGLESAPS